MLTITVEAWKGATAEEVFAQGRNVSAETGCAVVFFFEGVKCTNYHWGESEFGVANLQRAKAGKKNYCNNLSIDDENCMP